MVDERDDVFGKGTINCVARELGMVTVWTDDQLWKRSPNTQKILTHLEASSASLTGETRVGEPLDTDSVTELHGGIDSVSTNGNNVTDTFIISQRLASYRNSIGKGHLPS